MDHLEQRRLLASGDLDTSFGAGGRSADEVPPSADVTDAVQLGDGKILIAGGTLSHSIDVQTQYFLRRYNADGSLDQTFGDHGAGRDRIDGGDGADVISGGAGNDVLRGQASSDHLYGRDGNDNIFGGDGNDLIEGGNGVDHLHGDAGDDLVLSAGDGSIDHASGDDGEDRAHADPDDIVDSVETIV